MIFLREMSENDLDGVMEVEKESFSTPWTERLFFDELNNPHTVYYVCVDQDEVVAYGGLWHVLDEGQITNIAVKKAYRRRGVGTMLLEKIIDYANEHEIKKLELEVRAGNTPAIKLYEKYGFYGVGLRKGYYKNPAEDAILMDMDFAERKTNG